MKRQTSPSPTVAKTVRCAVYTRKSTEEGLEKEFNTLDAQRESAEAYIRSQAGESWVCLADRYDDGGFTGGNMDRPALQRLLADIKVGKVNCVVVYKVDRLSRSLLDFARMMELFDMYHVAFVSVTQQFNTASSMGRLVLNVLLSFAQFEREIISERTRDKIAAARRKGKWAGGHPILGYDIDVRGFKLVVNTTEARRVRAIFELYLKHQALIPVVDELERRGWCNKRWMTRKGTPRGGKPVTKTTLHYLLRNVVYVGRIKYKHETHPGEHPGIVDVTVFERVQALLKEGRPEPSVIPRRKSHVMLQGLIRCAPCGCAMVSSRTTRKKTKQYRYYVCSRAQQRGWKTCPSKSIPAGTIEQFVVDQIRTMGRDAAVRAQVLAPSNHIKAVDLDRALDAFDPMWSASTPVEQGETLRRVVERVVYDGAKKTVSITLKPTGLQSLIADLTHSNGVRS
jgi:site-specific DNA recombinase